MLTTIRNWLRSDMLILRWVLLALYGLVLGAMFLELGLDAGVRWAMGPIAFLVGWQLFFILGAGTTRLCKPIPPERLWMPVFVAAAMLPYLILGLLLGLDAVIRLGPRIPDQAYEGLAMLSWLVCAVVLWVYVQGQPRMRALQRLAGAMVVASLAELFATTACHVFVTLQRAPGATYDAGKARAGIMVGLTAMLLTSGPGLVLLFLRPRYRHEQMVESGRYCPACEYDLTGTFMAGRTTCPECGKDVAEALARSPLRPQERSIAPSG